jgi:hypothetical protein
MNLKTLCLTQRFFSFFFNTGAQRILKNERARRF